MHIYPRFPGFWPFHGGKKNGLGGNMVGGRFWGVSWVFFSRVFVLVFVLFTGMEGKWSLAKVQALSGRELLDFLVKRGVFPLGQGTFLAWG